VSDRVRLDDYMTVEEAARILELTTRRVRQLLAGNPPELDGLKMAGVWLIRRESVYTYLAQKQSD